MLALALQFLGGNPRAVLEDEERAPGEVNYLRGNDPARWQTRSRATDRSCIASSGRAWTCGLREQAGTLKYEFRVRPGRGPRISGWPTRRDTALRWMTRARC